MMDKINTLKKNQPATLLYCLIAGTAIFWIISNTLNVYKYALTGAVFEILWLPALLGTMIIPVIALICWYKKSFDIRSPFLYIAIASTILIVISMLS